MTEPLLDVHEVTKTFGGLTALDEVSFSVEEGEVLGFIGPNGSGKTTMFNCMMGFYDIDSGTIVYDGEDITGWDTHDIVQRGIAHVPQHAKTLKDLPVGANIKLYSIDNTILSLNSSAPDERLLEIAGRLQLAYKLRKDPDELAHADRRRLEIAKALATEPDLVLLDEPFAGMSQHEIDGLIRLLESLRDDGLTMIVVDHNMKGLMQFVDRVVTINGGQKIADGTPEEVAADERVQAAYFGETEVL